MQLTKFLMNIKLLYHTMQFKNIKTLIYSYVFWLQNNAEAGHWKSLKLFELTLFCCESIQKTLGCLCRSTPLLHTSSRSPQRRRPGPHRTFCGREASVSGITAASVSSGPQENWSPGTRTWPTFSVRLFNISSSFFSVVVRCFSSAATRYVGPQNVRHKPETETGVTVIKSD